MDYGKEKSGGKYWPSVDMIYKVNEIYEGSLTT
jgi:hypothetical protein